jgi:hypothetical protein
MEKLQAEDEISLRRILEKCTREKVEILAKTSSKFWLASLEGKSTVLVRQRRGFGRSSQNDTLGAEQSGFVPPFC